jgi:hypothetical protein
MATKKPWRTVLTGTSTGRFTREQIREAMDSVSGASKSDGSARGKAGGGGAKGQSVGSIARKGSPNASAAASENEKSAKARNGTSG